MVERPAEEAADQILEMRLTCIAYAGVGTNTYEFRPVDGGPVPAFTAGSHVDLHLPNGVVRQYSIFNPAAETHRYVLGIKRDEASRGGSTYIHDSLRVGQVLKLSAPRNHFPLVETAAPVVFLAGGIGVTPIYCMIQTAIARGLDWSFHYSVRRRDEAILLPEVMSQAQAHLHIDEESGGRFLDLPAILAAADPRAELYCCGPGAMLDAYVAAAEKAGFPPERIHLERFSAGPIALATDSFLVNFSRSGIEVVVHPGETILDVARAAGLSATASCEQGVCGACETKVLDGVPEHKDVILSDAEKAAGRTMMICCSGSLSDRLVLDL